MSLTDIGQKLIGQLPRKEQIVAWMIVLAISLVAGGFIGRGWMASTAAAFVDQKQAPIIKRLDDHDVILKALQSQAAETHDVVIQLDQKMSDNIGMPRWRPAQPMPAEYRRTP